jgi:parallel beta-helix repeat protein
MKNRILISLVIALVACVIAFPAQASEKSVQPDTVRLTLLPGQSAQVPKLVILEGTIPKGDIIFSFDLTGSMGDELAVAKAQAGYIMSTVAGLINDVQFGVMSYMDYPDSFSSCGYSARYGDPSFGDYAYHLDQPLTSDTNLVKSAIAGLTIGGGSDGPQDYERIFYESYADSANIGYRPGAKKILINIGDCIPHDCNLRAGIDTGTFSTGSDPGRDEIMGNADDLDLQTVLAGMATYGVSLLEVHGSTNCGYLNYWQYWCSLTGGGFFLLSDSTQIPAAVESLIMGQAQYIKSLTLQVITAGFGPWLCNLVPPYYLQITTPDTLRFTETICVPPDAPCGRTFTFQIMAVGDGVSYGIQTVIVTVPPCQGQILCVNCEGECYHSIQAAVDDAKDGDSIHVCCPGCGVYRENVRICGFNNLIIAAEGCDIDGGDRGDHHHDGCCEPVKGCTLMCATYPPTRSGCGFYISNSSNVKITGFVIVGYEEGIHVENSSGLNIYHNDIELNECGIKFANTDASLINCNWIHKNIYYDPWEGMGVYLWASDGNEISDNVIGWNGGDGVKLARGSDDNLITRNTIHDNVKYGTKVTGSSANNEIWSNCFYRNRGSVTSQGLDDGWDTGLFMYWDNGAIGNYWSDWDYAGGGWYPIDGSAGTSDRYPQTATVKIKPDSLKIAPSNRERIWIKYEPLCSCCPNQELYGYSLKLVFDSRYLDVCEVSPGPFPTIPPDLFPLMTWKVKHTETWDTLYIDQSCAGDTFATSKDPICLADVVFHGKTCSEAWLPVRIVDIQLRDHPYKVNIAVHTEDGYIKVLPECLKGFWASRGKDGVLLCWMDSPCHSHWGARIVKAPYNDYPYYRDIYEPDYPSCAYDSFFVFEGPDSCFFYRTPVRDIYYFSAFAVDDSGNYSKCYQTARATSYILGDFDGDGDVDGDDLWRLGRCYWTCWGDHRFDPYCDIGPTDTAGCGLFTPTSCCPPNPDSCINFEDLLIFAENFWIDPVWEKPAPIEMPSEVDISAPIVSGEKGNEVEIKLMVDNANGVKGMRIALDFDQTQLQLLSITPGKLASDSRIFFWSASDEIEISCAALGHEYTIGGSGEVASIRFKVLREGPVNLTSRVLDLRDVENHPINCTFNKGAVVTAGGTPERFALLQNYPNPFNPETYISFALPVASPVSLKIYNVAGQLVKSLADGEQMSAGLHMVRWDGTNQTGEKVASGIYFYKMNAGDFQATKKMVVTK